MPQMAPMSWLFLFFMFSAALILFTIINYFFTIYQPTTASAEEATLPKVSLNWKW